MDAVLLVLIVGVICLGAGLAVGMLIGTRKGREDSANVAVLQRQLDDARASLEAERASNRQELQNQKTASDRSLALMQQRFDETIAKMQAQVESTTRRMLAERQQEFSRSSKEDISRILEPLERSISDMKQAVSGNTEQHAKLGGQLSANIESVLRASISAKESADRLSSALHRSNNVQGAWGETVLRELLESQGLREGVHFSLQQVIRDNAGNAIRSADNTLLKPDLVLHLDNRRDVIVDAKVSMSSYLDYLNADTDEKRQQALEAHVASVQKHVDELARKDYSSYVQPPKIRMGYVIMFMPNSAALYAATQARPNLWRNAMERGVYIADEQTLYAALKIINLTWMQIAQNENHEKVYSLANEMLNRVGQFMDKFTVIGRSLQTASKAYEDGFAKLSDRGQSIPQTCSKLIRLGAKQQRRKGVPDTLLGLDEPEDEISFNYESLPD